MKIDRVVCMKNNERLFIDIISHEDVSDDDKRVHKEKKYNDLIRDIISYAEVFGEDEVIRKFEKLIIDLGCAELSYKFAKCFNKADIIAHEKIILDSGDAK